MVRVALTVLVLIFPGSAFAEQSYESDLEARCQQLVAEGKARRDGSWMELYRKAGEVCRSEKIRPEVRAEALLAVARAEDRDRELAIYEEVATLAREHLPDTPYLARALVRKAGVVFHQDRQASLDLLFESLAERERLFGTESREYVRGLLLVGIGYVSLDADLPVKPNLSTGLGYVQQAVDTSTELFGSLDPTTVAAKVQLAALLREQGRFDEAEAISEAIRDLEMDEGW